MTFELLQQDINNLGRWSTENGLRLNFEKCKSLHYGSYNSTYQYQLSENPVPQVQSVKDLGVILSNDLGNKEHVFQVVMKANRILGMIKKSFATRDTVALLILYKAFVRPILEFGCILWSPSTKNLSEHLEKVQKRFCMFFSQLNGLNYRSKLSNLQLMSLNARRLRYGLIYLFKIFICDVNISLEEFFIPSNRTVDGEKLTKLLMPRCKHKFRSSFFTASIVKHWNSLTFAERNVSTVDEFKRSVQSYFKRNDFW